MGTLSSSLSIATQAMLAEQDAISVTANNIANVNTPGYTRETTEMVEAPPIEYGGYVFGGGVQAGQITSQRNNVLQLRLDDETQQQGQYNSFLSSMQQVQTLFNETSGSGLQSSLSGFFNSLQQLSTNPSDLTLRQAVLTAAQNLAQSFNSTSANLTQLQNNIDLSVRQDVNQVNGLTSQIATLNQQIASAENLGQAPNTLVDQREQLVNQLAGLIGVSEIAASDGSITLTTTNGVSLVVGNQSYQLSTHPNGTNGFQDVYAGSADITSSITGGSLAGEIQARDQGIPSVLSSLDALAASLSTSMNSVNKAGTDLNGNPGGNFFTPPPAGGVGAASAMSVAISDPSQIAASLDGTAGDNSNVNAMIALQNQGIVNGQTPMNAYSSLIFQIGNTVSTAQTELQASQAISQQLQDQIGSVSGVSINEEAANLVQYERAYQAAAQVAGIVSSLTATAINLGQTTTVS